MLKLYDGATSVCAIKVRLALFEKSIPFKSCNIDLRAGDQFSPEYLRLNPNAVVPTLDDDGNIVTESSVIVAYLEDRFTNTRPLLPTKAYDRAQMRLWMKRVDDIVHPSIGALTHATVYRPSFLKLDEEGRAARLAKIPNADRRERFAAVYKDGLNAPVVANSVKTLNSLLLDMQSRLEDTDFLAGPTYTLADLAVTPYTNRLFDLGLLGLWANVAPRVFSWFSDIRERGNFAQAISNYATDADRNVYNYLEADMPLRVKGILDAG